LKEKLQEYALVAEIISAIAVVAGLIFVGLEIQQSTAQSALNTRALETAAYQDLVSQILDINNVWDSDPYLADLTDRGIRGELTDPVEVSMFRSYAITVSRHADMACFQYQQGILSEERLASALAIYMNQIQLGDSDALNSISAITAILPGLQDCIELVRPYFRASRLP